MEATYKLRQKPLNVEFFLDVEVLSLIHPINPTSPAQTFLTLYNCDIELK